MIRGRDTDRRGKMSATLLCLLTGAICLVVGGLCGGGLTTIFAVRPLQQQIERVMDQREAAEADMAQLGKAAQAVGNVLNSALPAGPSANPGSESRTPASESNARTVFENIRAGRPQALFKRCSIEFRGITQPDFLQQQLARYPLPLRTEAIGADLETLPPIDDNTHQYRYTTKSTNGKSATFTITMVFASIDGFSVPEWLLDQLVISEGTAENEPPSRSP